MRDALGPQPRKSVCFFWRVSNGLSGWLSQEDVDYLIPYVLAYDTVHVQIEPDIMREIPWYGLRLRASKTVTRSVRINESTTLTKVLAKDADTFYYFKDVALRDRVIRDWTD